MTASKTKRPKSRAFEKHWKFPQKMLTNLCRVSFAAAGVATALSLSTVAHAKNASSDNAAPPLVVTVRHFSIATTRAPLTR